MDSKEQIIVSLKRENDYLKRENDFLKGEFIKMTGTYPNIEAGSLILPPIQQKLPGEGGMNSEELEKLRDENIQLKKMKEMSDRQNTNLMNENSILTAKLNNLENVFIGSSTIRNQDGSVMNDLGDNYNMSTVRFQKLMFLGYVRE
jgi:hypothetical protein